MSMQPAAIAFASCLSVLFLLPSPPFVYGQSRSLRTLIAKTWTDREKLVRSLRIKWTEHVTFTKGSLSSTFDARDAKRLKAMGMALGQVIPPEDTSFDVPCSLSLDGKKFRYEREDRQWSGKDNAYVAQPYVSVFNGEVAKALDRKGTSYAPFPQGRTRNRPHNTHFLHLLPVLLTFRPFADNWTFEMKALEPTGRRAEIDGAQCIELEASRRNYLQRVWVNPQEEFTIRVAATSVRESPRTRVSIGYRTHPTVGYVPKAWQITRFNPGGKMSMSAVGEVQACEINPTLSGSEFELDFPPGARVRDEGAGKGPRDYVIKDDGEKRVILSQELGATYQQIMNSKPGEAFLERKDRSYFIPMLVALAMVAGGLFLWRRLRRKEGKPAV